jgi:AcrR family transcriptional regulator
MSDAPTTGGAGGEGAGPAGRRYRGLSAEERREARRSALMDAGYELYGTLGYRNVTIERACSHARLTARHFYEEFGGREALLRAVYDRTVGRALDAVIAALEDAGPSVRDRATAGIGAFVHAMLDDPRAARVVCVEVVGVSDDLERHRRSVLRAFADLVADEARRLIDRGEVVLRRDPRPMSLALVGGINELIVDWLQSDDHILPLDEVVAEMVDLFVAAGIGPPDWRPTAPPPPVSG